MNQGLNSLNLCSIESWVCQDLLVKIFYSFQYRIVLTFSAKYLITPPPWHLIQLSKLAPFLTISSARSLQRRFAFPLALLTLVLMLRPINPHGRASQEMKLVMVLFAVTVSPFVPAVASSSGLIRSAKLARRSRKWTIRKERFISSSFLNTCWCLTPMVKR